MIIDTLIVEIMSLILINCLLVVLIGSAFVVCAGLKEWFGVDMVEILYDFAKKQKEKHENKDLQQR